ncbi:cysteine--tRNA ligase [Demequina sp. SYSU T00039]|uniref:Cysteine--tRNA ligase n=1 Tax=Demequina lignilytica TaxID=3051663 RepID=A0AAW7M9A5_9MICO|nr:MULTISPECIES: cysteine--tRNA ligase [unclassified Demequina]MDN4477493.1 cysteine--tRNA ligase [Demequina sp. SYSU T00039-1]MDN4488156.1 cysteine--tRNA ligase [Demequina sp. SYSU T00039]MDN4490597.1 cysteine--tRNA ligase [Demequina sp. SYSU T00068]
MTLTLFDTATRLEREFAPLTPGKVGIYLCGPTVQSSPHVGHLRSAVAFDVLQRWLERSGYQVTMVRNVTDIDDKTLTKAAEAGWEWWAWALHYEREFQAAYSAVGVLPPAAEPRATGHIPEIVAIIGRLIEAGHAYEKDGSVYFDVRSYAPYGELTRQALEDLTPAPDAPAEDKRDPRDFALWKARKADEPDTASWASPWGRGRPGWHIECSAMAQRYLGDEFDIHGGGLDLRFPHHENEQAQSRAAGYGFAHLWMHSAWVTQSGAKMSKSLGNGLLVSEVLAEHEPAALRLALAAVHYRSMLEYSEQTLPEAAAQWGRFQGFVARASEKVGAPTGDEVRAAELPASFVEAMDDDLAVPRALAVIHETVRAGNAALTAGDDAAVAAALLAARAMLDVLGLDPAAPEWAGGSSGADDAAMTALDVMVRADIEARAAARAAKDWATADAIRDRLAAAGIVVADGADGARWSLASDG